MLVKSAAYITLSLLLWGCKGIITLNSPLRHLPGPFFTAYHRLSLKLYTLRGKRMYYLEQLHREYGPVVRIGPNEASVVGSSGQKQIYNRGGGFRKSCWYDRLLGGKWKERPLFLTTDPEEAADRRDVFRHVLRSSHLRHHWEPVVRQHVETTVRKIKEDALRGSADVFRWWRMMTADIMAHICFGDSFGMVESGKEHWYMHALRASAVGISIRDELPWLATLLRAVPLRKVRHLWTALGHIFEYNSRIIESLKGKDTTCHTLFHDVLQDNTYRRLTDDKIKAEAAGFVLAGSDTTTSTLTYAIWQILLPRHQSLRLQLEEEVEQLGQLDNAALASSSLLSHIIKETLRLHPAIPTSLPRTVPAGGATIENHFLPENTIVSTASYLQHRQESIFRRPSEFLIERWKGPDAARQQAASFAFGAGRRSCIGQDLAMMVMRYAIALFVKECKGATLGADMTPDSMEMVDYVVLEPKGGRCIVSLAT